MLWCLNFHNDQWYSHDKNHFIEILNFCTKNTEICKMDYPFCFEKKGLYQSLRMWLYMLWPFIATAVVLKRCLRRFSKSGLIFKNCKFLNWHKNLSSPKIQTNLFFSSVLGLMHQTITCKLKSSEKDFSRQFYPLYCDFDMFVPKIYPWLAIQFNLLQKQSLWTGERI